MTPTAAEWLYKVNAATRETSIAEFYVKAPGMGEAIAIALDYLATGGTRSGELVVFDVVRTIAPPPIVNPH